MIRFRLAPASALWLAISTLVFPVLAQNQEPETLPDGAFLVEKSANAYANLQSYKGKSAVISSYEAEIKSQKITQLASAWADLDYTRGGDLTFTGVDTSGQPMKITRKNGQVTFVFSQNGQSKTETTTLQSAIAGATGIAAGAFTTIPAALQRQSWGYPFAIGAQYQTQGRERIGTRECFVVQETDSRRAGERKFWIDSQDFLLRQLSERAGEEKFDFDVPTTGVPPEVLEQMRQTKQLGRFQIEVFSIESAKMADNPAPAKSIGEILKEGFTNPENALRPGAGT